MSSEVVLAIGQVLAVVGAFKGWDTLTAYFQSRKARHTPPHGTPAINGFSRDDHAQLAIIADRLERLDRLEATLGRLDNDFGRLVIVLELEKLRRAPT